MFVSLWCDMREVGLVMQVAAVCMQVGTSDLKFDCPMVGLEAGWDNKPEGFYSQHWVYECIVTSAALVCAIRQFLVLSVVSFLFLWEFMEEVCDTNVLEHGGDGNAMAVG